MNALMNTFVKVVNQVLYFAYDTIDKIFQAFGFSWVGVVTGLAIISVILRLFAGNLVGSAVPAMHEGADTWRQHRAERNRAKEAAGLGKQSVRLSRTAWKNSRRKG